MSFDHSKLNDNKLNDNKLNDNKLNDNCDIIIEIDDYTFNLKKKTDYYIVIINNTTFDWIDSLNMYSVSKKPSSNKLIEKILTKLGKNNNNKLLNNKLLNNNQLNNNQLNNNQLNNNPSITSEMIIYNELNRIKQIQPLINQSLNHTLNQPNLVKKIFNDNTVRDIIINEYIKIFTNLTLNNITKHDKYTINIIDNIYVWNICFNININKIIMNIVFDPKYYPYAPPQIRFVSPKLHDKLDHRISNCKIFKLDYWNPTTSINNIIEVIYKILTKYAKCDDTHTNKKINIDLYQKLLILSSYITNDSSDELDEYFGTTKFKNVDNINVIKKQKDKFNGIGYRSGENNWKIEDYENIQKTKEYELISVLTGILNDLEKINKDELYDTIENSLLIKFLVDTFNQTSLLDISKRIDLFKLCFNITQHLCIDKIVMLLFDERHHLFNSIKKLYDLAKLSAKFDANNDIITQIMFVWSMIESMQELNIKKINKINTENTENINTDLSYINVMKSLRFDTANIISSNYKNGYTTAIKSTKTSTQCMKRLSTEIPTLASELPIHPDASIFLRVDEANPRSMRALITGPPDTPYDSGIFIFDIYLPPNYPTDVPMVNFTNTGNKRFNPNLYNCGKVCLSILGTYVGPAASQTEKWNTSSTLYQVLLSIQGQILVEHPYFNEPGHQASYKTTAGTKASDDYNHNIRLYTMQHAMLDLMNNDSFPEFKTIIDQHFKLKKNKIIDVCTKWIEKPNLNENYKKIGNEIIAKLSN